MAVPTCRTWHFSRLKGICQTVDHSPMAARSLCRARTDSGFAALIPSLVSSANLGTLLERPRSRSLIYITKRIGPKLTLTAVHSEGTPLTMTLCLLPANQFSIQKATLPWMPRARTFLMSLLWGTLSKALRKSKKTTSTALERSHSQNTYW